MNGSEDMGNFGNRVTIRDIAAACEVSTATVSRVLNHIPGGYSAKTENRILNAAEKLGYVPNRMARSLITRRTNLIAVLVPDIHYCFFQDFFVGLEQYLNRYGYRVLLCNTQERQDLEEQYIRELCNGLVDGIIISTLNKEEGTETILDIWEKGFPVILLERYGKNLDRICQLHVDNYGTGRMAVEHLVSRGHRRIAFIRGSEEAYNARIRFDGYVDALKENHIPYDSSLVETGNYSFDSGTAAMEKLLERDGFTAVIGANDLMTVGACKAITQKGLKIPDDISVIGVDSTILTRTQEPAITAMDFCATELGEKAGSLLTEMIDGRQQKQIIFRQEARFVWGQSVKNIE